MAEQNFRPLTRDQLSRICGGNQEAIRAFEKLFQQSAQVTPAEVIILFQLAQEVAIQAQDALTAANNSLAALQLVIDSLGLEPQLQVGTIAAQNADAVEITGGNAALATAAVSTDNGVALTNQTSGAGALTGTLTNSPTVGNPAFWLRLKINGANVGVPAWAVP